MNLLKCLLIENDCYKTGRTITPRGVMVHSTGVNNPTVARYVNPVRGQESYDALIAAIGKNLYGNHWNTPRPGGQSVCVHAFLGKLADGSIGTVQTLPWDMRGWHAGGAANNTHISFEICEDGLSDRGYFERVYREAAELTAYLCRLYGLDPLADGVVLCHAEGARRGWASDHVDVEHWFPKFGKSMDDFRRDVKGIMEEDEEMTKEQKDALFQEFLERLTGRDIVDKLNAYQAGLEAPEWAREELAEAMEMGITDGTQPMRYVPRFEAALMAKRAARAREERDG